MAVTGDFSYPGEHVYDGIIFPGIFPADVLDRIKLQDFYDSSDILVVTYPKAGTTWMQEIVYTLKEGKTNSENRTKPLIDIFPYLELAIHGPAGLDLALAMPSPRCMKSHLPVRFFDKVLANESQCPKIIYVARNPKDTLVSFFYFHKLIHMIPDDMTWNEYFELFRNNKIYNGDIFDHMVEWWKYRDHSKVLYVKYEDMLSDTPGAIRQTASFLKYNTTDAEIEEIAEFVSFKNMKGRPLEKYFKVMQEQKDKAPFFRKGTKDDWRNHFNEEQSEYIDKLMKEKFEEARIYLSE